jgi:AsmA protein
MNADIRLSATSARIGELTASNAAASVSLRDRRLEIGLAQAAFNGGSLTGNVAVTDAVDARAVEMQLRATDVAFAFSPPTLGLPHAIGGTASVLVDVGTRGHNLGDLVSQLTGTTRINVSNGTVPVFGLADVIAASGGPANPQPAEGLASVAVDSASVGFSFSGGVGMLERGNVVTKGYAADVQGWIGLLDGTLGLNGAMKTGATTAAVPESAQSATPPINFTIEGTLVAPVAHTLDAPPQPVVPVPVLQSPAPAN